MSEESLSSRVPRADEWPKPAQAACHLCRGRIDTNCDGERATVMHEGTEAYFVHRACLEREAVVAPGGTFAEWFAARVGAIFEEHEKKSLLWAWNAGTSSERARLREKVEVMRSERQVNLDTVRSQFIAGEVNALDRVLALLSTEPKP